MLTYSFDRDKLVQGILDKRSLDQFIDKKGEAMPESSGLIAIMDVKQLIVDYFDSVNFAEVKKKLISNGYFEMRDHIPKLPMEILLKYFPDLNINIDTQLILKNPRLLESNNILRDLSDINNHADKISLILYVSNENPDCIGIVKDGHTYIFNYNNPLELANKLPGFEVLFNCL
ncbi:MAG: hypothetical protein H0X03_06860 [Nitrosopumilus sp.]|nr:hypothetical protein [Nitrosopumilus sp.]